MKIIFNLWFALAVLCITGCGEAPKNEVQTAAVNIISTPAGATVYFNGVKKGEAPAMGRLPAGYPILITAELPGYRPQMQLCRPEVSAQPTTLNFNLEPVQGILVVRTEPAGAALTVNGASAGLSPATVYNLPIGEHTVRAERAGFLPVEQRVTVPPDGMPVAAKLQLASMIGTLSVTSSVPGARVFLNGKESGVTPYEAKINEGVYEVQLKLEGYSDMSRKVTVAREERTELNLPMSELPASITVSTDPANAALYFKGTLAGNAPHTFSNLAAGSYRIRAELNGFDAEEEIVTVQRGGEASVNLKLNPNTGAIHISALPPGVSVYVNGKRMGSVEADPSDPKRAKIFTVTGLSAGSYEVKIAHKDGTPSFDKETVTVVKGQTARTKNLKIWVPDAWIYTKSNPKPQKVQLEYQNAGEVVFRPIPGIQRRYSTAEVEKVERIDIREPFDSEDGK